MENTMALAREDIKVGAKVGWSSWGSTLDDDRYHHDNYGMIVAVCEKSGIYQVQHLEHMYIGRHNIVIVNKDDTFSTHTMTIVSEKDFQEVVRHKRDDLKKKISSLRSSLAESLAERKVVRLFSQKMRKVHA
ncbi:MAG: hypothetical protein AAB421_00490 [Patescibacteria group bacterium]